MRLIELDPRWLIQDGRRVGFVFRCPTRCKCWQSCFVESPPRREQWALFRSTFGEDPDFEEMPKPDVQGCASGTRWQIAGGIENADFETLSVTPSIDGSPGGNWHGFITNGEIVGGL